MLEENKMEEEKLEVKQSAVYEDPFLGKVTRETRKVGGQQVYMLDSSWTQEQIDSAPEGTDCYYCNDDMSGKKMWFKVKKLDVPPRRLAELNDLPFCCAACAFESSQRDKNDIASTSKFFEFHGTFVKNISALNPAPPKELMYGPNKMSRDEWKKLRDDGWVAEIQHQEGVFAVFPEKTITIYKRVNGKLTEVDCQRSAAEQKEKSVLLGVQSGPQKRKIEKLKRPEDELRGKPFFVPL